jgi:hypothetical protein
MGVLPITRAAGNAGGVGVEGGGGGDLMVGDVAVVEEAPERLL